MKLKFCCSRVRFIYSISFPGCTLWCPTELMFSVKAFWDLFCVVTICVALNVSQGSCQCKCVMQCVKLLIIDLFNQECFGWSAVQHLFINRVQAKAAPVIYSHVFTLESRGIYYYSFCVQDSDNNNEKTVWQCEKCQLQWGTCWNPSSESAIGALAHCFVALQEKR